MLIAIMTILFLGGSGTAMLEYIGDIRDDVKLVLPKDDRQKEALDTIKAMKKRTSARNKETKRIAKGLSKALINHDVSDAEIDAYWTEFHEDLGSYNRDLLDLRFELKEHISREEWAAIFGGDR